MEMERLMKRGIEDEDGPGSKRRKKAPVEEAPEDKEAKEEMDIDILDMKEGNWEELGGREWVDEAWDNKRRR